MTSRAILRRLLALEAEVRSCEPPPNSPLGMWLIAYHLGRWRPHESVSEAAARALGYANSMQFQNGLRMDHDDLEARYQLAISKMLASGQSGKSPGDDISTALYNLVDAAERGGMPLPPLGTSE
jgi:hypothetical protein